MSAAPYHKRPSDAGLVEELREVIREQAAKLAAEMYVAPADRAPALTDRTAPADRLFAEDRRSYETGEWAE